jgi:type II restriction enzyme
MDAKEKAAELAERLGKLSPVQLELIESITAQLIKPPLYNRKLDSDLISDGVLWSFGDSLRIHHCFSVEPFTKDRFEYALERAINANGGKAVRASRGNPGHDLTIGNTAYSLKTQANQGIKADFIHISKFMELGKGTWTDKVEDLAGLRDQMFHHMRSYERIITLRKLPVFGSEFYELVEIPKALLLEAANGRFESMTSSKQNPRPGYCRVFDDYGTLKFELYFDGGSERKLQVRQLRKSLCTVHATWKFPANQPLAL